MRSLGNIQHVGSAMNYATYFAVLITGWAAIWSAGLWYFHIRLVHGPVLRRLTGKQRVLLAFAVAAVPCAYCFSYAPFLRILTTHPEWRPTIAAFDDLFVPVQWLIDHTLLCDPLLWWADFCQVPDQLLSQTSEARMRSFWGQTPPWLYASGWVLFGSACCVVPPYLAHRLMRCGQLMLTYRRSQMPTAI